MKDVFQALIDSLQSLALLKPRPDAFSVPLTTHVTIYGIYILSLAGLERAWTEGPRTFDASGIASALAALCISLALLSLLPLRSRGAAPERIVLGSVAVSIPMLALAAVYGYLLRRLAGISPANIDIEDSLLPLAAFLVLVVWGCLVLFRLIYGMVSRQRALLAFAGMFLVLISPFILPNTGIIKGRDDEDTQFSLLQVVVDALRRAPEVSVASQAPAGPPIDGEALMMRQHALVAKSISDLQPARQGQAELYFVGFASYSQQDVFRREVAAVKELFDERFGTSGRSIILQNHRESIDDVPLASVSNLETVLREIGGRMNVERDVLVLFVTSHGFGDVISVSMEGVRLNNLTPPRLVNALAQSGIKNRVLVLSACYSGSFVSDLSDDNTLILTAARSDRTSFGCSNEREWTFFGDAYFNHALRKERSFIRAYERARVLIESWEKAQGLTASEPQMFVGAAIRDKIDAILAARVTTVN